ncbi:dual specificity protein phosphatase family protein [Patescibacteria group bacterium]|nr:dual specificity protein phosphatase family protein [Patescibacteria group bacterium]MBU1890262.1 dual specificity protein phosphatase family protein [Patescibacteria group bacterium]
MATKVFNYTRLSKYIYLGTTLYSHRDLETVLSLGIKADVDLELEKMDHPENLTAYLWLPVRDFEAPSIEQFYLGVYFIDQLVKRRIKTLVHCNVGFGRAPSLIAAYFAAYRGKGITEAISFMSHKRPGVSPNTKQIAGIKRFIGSFSRSLTK